MEKNKKGQMSRSGRIVFVGGSVGTVGISIVGAFFARRDPVWANGDPNRGWKVVALLMIFTVAVAFSGTTLTEGQNKAHGTRVILVLVILAAVVTALLMRVIAPYPCDCF